MSSATPGGDRCEWSDRRLRSGTLSPKSAVASDYPVRRGSRTARKEAAPFSLAVSCLVNSSIEARLIPTRGLADSLGLPKSSRVRIDGGEGEIRHATGAYTSRGL